MTEYRTDNSDDFIRKIEAIRESRQSNRIINNSKSIQGDIKTFRQVNKIIESVIEDFIKADRLLFIQSSNFTDYFVSYGCNHIFHIWIASATETSVEILIQSASVSKVVYLGELQEENIENAIRNVLLQWYSNLS